ncbi:MAG TPA: class I SAM-dependent methyltransferase [Planctomycetota bacterium]|nr:class I SAM-dependent methyltransferase [Planctomycetota bacterium]
MVPNWAHSSRRFDPAFESWNEWGSRRVPAFHGLIERRTATLTISESDIRRVARYFRVPTLPEAFVLQAWHEFRLKARNVVFRSGQNEKARGAYCAMRPDEFQHINARQAWANWRTIPRSINGRLPNSPILALDLCCGTGQSTSVMACYAAPHSELLGLEYNPNFVEAARRRAILNDRRAPARARFHAQSVLETFCFQKGRMVPDRAADWVNSSGAVGCHFRPAETEKLAAEISRVLKPGGIATIDSGPDGTSTEELKDIFQRLGFTVLGQTKSCALDRFTHVTFRRGV